MEAEEAVPEVGDRMKEGAERASERVGEGLRQGRGGGDHDQGRGRWSHTVSLDLLDFSEVVPLPQALSSQGHS